MMDSHDDWFRGGPFSICWTAIFGGAVVAAGVFILLHTAGVAVGFSQIDPSDSTSLRAIGIGAGIWTVVTSILALFCGGWTVARFAGVIGRGNATLHGLVLWGAVTVSTLVLVASLASRLGAGATNVSLPDATVSDFRQALDQSANETLAAVNQRLERAGKPSIEPAGLRAAMQDALQTAMRSGTLEWSTFERALADHTELTTQDVQQIVAGSQQRIRSALDEAARATARTFWGLFFVSLLSMIASVAGAALGVTRRQRELSAQVQEEPFGHLPGHHHPQTA